MGNVAVATIITKNYLSLARVLVNSLRRFHPDVPCFVLLVDEIDGYFDPADEPFHLLRLTDLCIPELAHFRFAYGRQELVCATKPFLLKYLLDQGFASAVFLDADILILDDLEQLFTQVNHHAIVLTPHLLKPLAAAAGIARERNILQSGVYNGGCVGVSATPTAYAFLDWWQARLYAYCRYDVAHGMYYDQRWLDFVPAYFDNVYILRDPGFNVGHWNLPEREVHVGQDAVLVDGVPCRFMHFSGYDADYPQVITRYSYRLNMQNVGSTASLFRQYHALLVASGYHQTKHWPYAYDRFDNGVRVTPWARYRYRALGAQARRFGDPLQTAGPHSYWRWFQRQPRWGRGWAAGTTVARRMYRRLNQRTQGRFGASPLVVRLDRLFRPWLWRHPSQRSTPTHRDHADHLVGQGGEG